MPKNKDVLLLCKDMSRVQKASPKMYNQHGLMLPHTNNIYVYTA